MLKLKKHLGFFVLPLHSLSNQIVTNNFIITAQPTMVWLWKTVFFFGFLYSSEAELENIIHLESAYQTHGQTLVFLFHGVLITFILLI